MSKESKENIRIRVQEIIKRIEQLEEINQKLISEGKQDEFDAKYGIEYQNLSEELYHQRKKMQDLDMDFKN
jgi:predicted DNA-binding protein (UPF0251 family)